jgi:Zn finger protein HypA/HybF involved in hydrogenase expression
MRWVSGWIFLTTVGVLSAVVSAAGQSTPRPATRSPHGTLNTSCENCHTFTAWKPLRGVLEFDHSRTRYPLRGLHAGVSCKECHVSLVFTNVSTKCDACHADIHRQQFGSQCERCHSVKGWQISLASVRGHLNRFPLVGAHTTVACDACHKGAATSQFTGLSTECIACHTQTFIQTTLPNHQAAHFPTSCELCHSMDGWQGAAFDHARFTGFALVGAHARLDCTACHVGGNFQSASTNCVSCHLKDFTAAKNPDHVQAGFPQTCALCHNMASWVGATFDHNAFTNFPLTGAHVNVPCAQCHVNGRYAGTPRDCASCHLADYQKTNNPNHAAAGFPQDCSICHSTASWAGATFDHSKTGFPLTGAHLQLNCVSCHVGGKYTGLSATCVSCHLTNYNSTTNPNHVAAGFPQQCEVCHTTTAWTPASFDHSKTGFPLTGAHATTPCASCHVGGRYAGTPTDCYSCHKTDYTSVTNPNHVAAGFPTDCSQCHTTTTWAGAVFNHTWFPIYSGAHQGKWTTCNDCHVNPSNFAVFSCTNCHAHDKTTTDAAHKDVRNYVYNSANCYSCHPIGQSGG